MQAYFCLSISALSQSIRPGNISTGCAEHDGENLNLIDVCGLANHGFAQQGRDQYHHYRASVIIRCDRVTRFAGIQLNFMKAWQLPFATKGYGCEKDEARCGLAIQGQNLESV
jgi:hypothetical protein